MYNHTSVCVLVSMSGCVRTSECGVRYFRAAGGSRQGLRLCLHRPEKDVDSHAAEQGGQDCALRFHLARHLLRRPRQAGAGSVHNQPPTACLTFLP